MRVVLCTHRFLPHFVGGVEVYTLRLARVLQNRGHEVYILAGEPTPREDLAVEVQEEVYEGIPVTRLIYDYDRRPVTNRASYSDPLVTAQIRTTLQKWQPEVVHATNLSLLMAGTIEAAASLNLPVVYTASDFVLTCRRGTYLKWDNQICSRREEVKLCTACMGPHTHLETWLTQAWRLAPQRLANPLLPIMEKIVGKKADFVHAAASIQQRFNYLPRWVQKIERIIAPSSYMRDLFILNNFPTERIIVSPYGVELPKADFKKVPSPKLRFGFIGRITPLKGVHLLLAAFARLLDQTQAELTIYGQADVKADRYLQTLQSQVAHLSNVKFAGFVDNANIAELYRQLDVLVVPSIWPENSPITILEAQAYGTLVIASDVRGIADLVQHEVNGLIFTNQDGQDLAAQMARCLASPELVASLASKSRPVKSIQEDAGYLISLYQEVLRGR